MQDHIQQYNTEVSRSLEWEISVLSDITWARGIPHGCSRACQNGTAFYSRLQSYIECAQLQLLSLSTGYQRKKQTD
jgi:hypothetical protein